VERQSKTLATVEPPKDDKQEQALALITAKHTAEEKPEPLSEQVRIVQQTSV
jgi:hypothetical protein